MSGAGDLAVHLQCYVWMLITNPMTTHLHMGVIHRIRYQRQHDRYWTVFCSAQWRFRFIHCWNITGKRPIVARRGLYQQCEFTGRPIRSTTNSIKIDLTRWDAILQISIVTCSDSLYDFAFWMVEASAILWLVAFFFILKAGYNFHQIWIHNIMVAWNMQNQRERSELRRNRFKIEPGWGGVHWALNLRSHRVSWVMIWPDIDPHPLISNQAHPRNRVLPIPMNSLFWLRWY